MSEINLAQQVDFYLLGSIDKSGKFKYACRIAQKAYQQGLKVFVQAEDLESCEMLDALLWTFSQGSFVPHAVVRDDSKSWDDFPVQIGDNASIPKHADLLISLSAGPPNQHRHFNRIADLVIDDPVEKQTGRTRFKFYRDLGITPNTHNVG